jgi:uncharacterized membrane protein
VQIALAKGTKAHRIIGWMWVVLLMTIAFSSFGIQMIRPGKFSYIHLLSLYTLIAVPLGVMHARRGRIKSHARTMLFIFFGGLVVAGAFTLIPERIMYRVFFTETL